MRKWIILAVSLAIVLSLVRVAGFGRVADVWRNLEPIGIVISVACYYVSLALRVVSWRVLLAPDAPRASALAPPLALGFVLGHVSPAKSGEPATAILVSKSFALPLSRTLSVLTAERVIQALVLLATYVACAGAVWGASGEIGSSVAVAGALFFLIAVGVGASGLSLPALAPRCERIPRIGGAVANYLRALADLFRSRRRLLGLSVLALAFWVFQYLSLWAILWAGGTGVGPFGAAVVAGSSILGGTLSMIPLGTQDGISAVVLARLGVPLARGFSLSLFHTLLSLACGLALLAFLPVAWRRRERGPM